MKAKMTKFSYKYILFTYIGIGFFFEFFTKMALALITPFYL